MRAVSLVEAERLEVVEMPAPEVEAGEVLIRVWACGICGSDLTSYKRGLFIGVPGHEVAGVVESVARGCKGGSRVTAPSSSRAVAAASATSAEPATTTAASSL